MGLSAIRQKDVDQIRAIVAEIDDSDWIRILRERYPDSSIAQRLAYDLENMRGRCDMLLKKFEDMLRMRKKIEDLKQSTIAEIKSYSDPPASVGEVMTATFILLGEDYKKLQVSKYRQFNRFRKLIMKPYFRNGKISKYFWAKRARKS